jgi:hypothetical protein
VGIRRPLGVGAGGLAILCALPPAETEDIIETHADSYPKLSTLTASRVRDAAGVVAARLRNRPSLHELVFEREVLKGRLLLWTAMDVPGPAAPGPRHCHTLTQLGRRCVLLGRGRSEGRGRGRRGRR